MKDLRLLLLALTFQVSSAAMADASSSSLHAGHVEIKSSAERKLFPRLLCQCGDCARLPLSTCACGWADSKRDEIRSQLASGISAKEIEASYREAFGPKAIAVPDDRGLDRALWAVPLAGIFFAGIWLVRRAKAWQLRKGHKDKEDKEASMTDTVTSSKSTSAELDHKLEKALDELERP